MNILIDANLFSERNQIMQINQELQIADRESFYDLVVWDKDDLYNSDIKNRIAKKINDYNPIRPNIIINDNSIYIRKIMRKDSFYGVLGYSKSKVMHIDLEEKNVGIREEIFHGYDKQQDIVITSNKKGTIIIYTNLKKKHELHNKCNYCCRHFFPHTNNDDLELPSSLCSECIEKLKEQYEDWERFA